MVFYSEQADRDLDEILDGLLLCWSKIELSREFCLSYISDIIDTCDCLVAKTFHSSAIYETHKQYGAYVHRYKRNANTIWYVIYNKAGENVYVEKILSNYLTSS